MENLFLINEWNYRACYKKSSIKTLKLKQLSLKCDNLLWWYDYLTLVSFDTDILLTCPCFSKVRNDSNNAQILIPGAELEKCPFDFVNITLTKKGKVSTYMVSVSYNNQPINLCRFVFFGSVQSDDKKNLMAQIDIYWKAWRLQSAFNNEFLLDSFIRSLILRNTDDFWDSQDYLINAFFTYYVSRADFRIDFWSKDKSFYDDIIHPYDLLKRKMSGKNEYYKDDGKTYSSKNVGRRENKYVYIRFYDKKQEILDDNTQFLYSDYYNYKWNIWRLEFQFMSRFTTARQKYNFWDIFLGSKNWNVLLASTDELELFWWLTKQIFEYLWLDIKKGCFSRFYSPDEIPFNNLPLWKKKSIATRLKNTLNYLESNGINALAFIDASYRLNNDKKWLENFQDSIIHYIDKKDDIVPKLFNKLKNNLPTDDSLEILDDSDIKKLN